MDLCLWSILISLPIAVAKLELLWYCKIFLNTITYLHMVQQKWNDKGWWEEPDVDKKETPLSLFSAYDIQNMTIYNDMYGGIV